MYNKVILVGNLTRDVEMRYLPSGGALAKLGLATNRRYKKQDGSHGEEVCFIDVNLFGRSAEVANQYLKKGSKILIEGRLVLESWTDQSGQKRSKHSITAESMQMLDSRGSGGYEHDEYSGGYDSTPSYEAPARSVASSRNQQQYKEPQIPEIDINDDEIPF